MAFEAHIGRLYDTDAERGVLGALMLSDRAFADVLAAVEARDFYESRNELIFSLAVGMYTDNRPVDAVTLTSEVAQRGQLRRIGGATYLHECMAAIPTAANAGYYAELVARAAVRRRLTEAGARIREMGLSTDDPEDVKRLRAAAYEVLDSVESTIKPTSGTIADTVDSVLAGMENPGTVAAYRSGLRALDEIYRGAAPGRMDVFAARPGVGKSLLATGFMRKWAIRDNIPVLMFSLEMSAEEIMQRMISAEARVLLHRITDTATNPLDEADWARVAQVTPAITNAPIRIHDRPVGLPDIVREVREEVRKGVHPIVIVDFLQLMLQPPRAESRQVGVGMNADGLKHVAREFDVPVICLSQLNRNPDKRGDGVPRLSDLRESGAIEQSADCVVLIHRPDMEVENSPRAGEADLLVPKQRNGRTGTATVVFRGHYAKFCDFA